MAEEDPRVREAFHQLVVSLLTSYCAGENGVYSHCSYHLRKCFPPMTTADVLSVIIAKFSDALVDYESKNQFSSATKILSSIAHDFEPSSYPMQWGFVFSDVS